MAASPAKSLLEEVETFRGIYLASLAAFSDRMQKDLDAIREKVLKVDDPEKISSGKLRDLRDMLTLLRNLDVKPEKGRRKDLKKLDSVIEDLTQMLENW